MNASTKLGIALLVIFTTCLFALLLELVYVLQRKRQPLIVSGGPGLISSKELLYFFCCKNKPTRVEPSSGVVSTTSTEAATAADSEAATMEEEEYELAKWHEVYGQSRVLYTIKEGEREGADSVETSSGQSETKSEKRVCLSGRVEMPNDVAVVVDVGEEEATPFSTPISSPSYFTPSPSPGRDVAISISSLENDDLRSSETERPESGTFSLSTEGIQKA
ncbi:hypothetical protein ES332_A04G093700v1 [Gossypium tomentosum]|uniref:Uncharacterized protein n=1 Tax=Gossypium tomentosum TaxID=34277 RepID=A0A5D2QWS4_GOSTO|nr:hypothetical protein ES332_A04G093700v1 [Gossypium tomentosum]